MEIGNLCHGVYQNLLTRMFPTTTTITPAWSMRPSLSWPTLSSLYCSNFYGWSPKEIHLDHAVLFGAMGVHFWGHAYPFHSDQFVSSLLALSLSIYWWFFACLRSTWDYLGGIRDIWEAAGGIGKHLSKTCNLWRALFINCMFCFVWRVLSINCTICVFIESALNKLHALLFMGSSFHKLHALLWSYLGWDHMAEITWLRSPGFRDGFRDESS